MCARYRMVRNPNPTGDKKKQALHPRVVPYGTLHTDEVIKEAESRSGMSGADIKGALRVLADVMVSRLDQGYNIELDGLGFFSVSLTSRPVMDKKEIRSESIHFKNVNFRCGKYLKSKLKTMHLERIPEGKGVLPPFEERVRRLTEYLNTHHFITCSDYRDLTGCSKYRALEDLNKLINEGKLEKGGYRSTRVYSFPSSKTD
ncbi:HU family DNA-binding protein [Parabacteroides gordonii]|uniref:HU family DNA-binding protein n=1 Tax=Parabacteroides gordonii TaxID=574930 RepID=UPI0026ECA114|nr:HU family DNA-binding protein [Parabacteroides gordonii]